MNTIGEIREIALAVETTWETCMGFFDEEFPRKHGNCFSVLTQDGRSFAIVSFCVENLREAVRRGVEFPIKIAVLSDEEAVIHDERIPDDWYFNDWCTACCPEELLPLPQRMQHKRQRLQGFRVDMPGCHSFHPDRRPVLDRKAE